MKKKIRAVQFGVGPIGAAIVRLMREKSSIEIVGAIDSDPAKAGRDLGEVVQGREAPWGVPITSDAAEGNIGYPGEPKEVTHFGKMLRTTARHLSESEIKLLLVDAARK